MSANSKMFFVQHHDDEGIDEIQILVDDKPFIRCVMVPRYKTSGMSGDEWRVSAMWEMKEGGLWVPFDGPYRSLLVAAAAIFPGVYVSHGNWHYLRCTAIRLLRKRRQVIDMSHDSTALPLLMALGHLPWTMQIWNEMPGLALHGMFGGDVTKDLCFQVGCVEPAISTYVLKSRFTREGLKYESNHGLAVRFCAKHLQRGDCGLEDADRNYEVFEGPGPEKHATDTRDISPSTVVVIGGK